MFQVEYAAKAVEISGTAVGVRCKDGVVMGFEKLIISKMLVEVSSLLPQRICVLRRLSCRALHNASVSPKTGDKPAAFHSERARRPCSLWSSCRRQTACQQVEASSFPLNRRLRFVGA